MTALEEVEDARTDLRRVKTIRRLHATGFVILGALILWMLYLSFAVVHGDAIVGTALSAFVLAVGLIASVVAWFDPELYTMVRDAQRRLDRAHEELAESIRRQDKR